MDTQALIRRIASRAMSMIRLVYRDLGDFGGTNPIANHWFVEVAGPYDGMQTLVPILKKYGYQFDSVKKSWRLDAVFYKFPNARSSEIATKNRAAQKASVPILTDLVKEWNEKAQAYNRQLKSAPSDTRGLVQSILSDERGRKALAVIGITINMQVPDSYSAQPSMVWVTGNTYNYRSIFSKLGFRFAQGPYGKGWGIGMEQYSLVSDQMTRGILKAHRENAEVAAELDPTPKGTLRSFDRMSDAELIKFIKQNGILDDYLAENEYFDGEYDEDDTHILQMLMNHLRKQSPKMQDAILKDRSLR
jgi:hypothetical protein